jgi:hypothetical protein
MTPQEKALVQRILDRLGHIELDFKKQGLVNHGYGARLCIVAVMKLTGESEPEPAKES